MAIPKVQPRFAIAIWKKYPTMKSLLRVYMDPSKSVSNNISSIPLEKVSHLLISRCNFLFTIFTLWLCIYEKMISRMVLSFSVTENTCYNLQVEVLAK